MTEKLNFRMPAEWEPHRATWIAWPHQESDWEDKFSAIDWVYCEIVRTLACYETVEIVCHSQELLERAKYCLERCASLTTNYRLHLLPNNRSWLRDSAPTAVKDPAGKTFWTRWTFNAWAKYDNFELDQKIPELVSQVSGYDLINAHRLDTNQPLILEGGAIDVDGQGTLLCTEECLQSEIQLRNSGLTKEGYEQAFKKYLGVTKTIWLGNGCAGDDTHGHIDDISRFVAPGVVVTAYEEDPTDPNFEPLDDNYKRLCAATDSTDKKLQVIKIPMPSPLYFGEMRLPASYLNFYIANGVVIVPTFNDLKDRIALQKLAELFPTRKVIGIHAVDLVLGFGTLHCLSQQEPR